MLCYSFLTVCRFQRGSVQDYQLSVGDLGVLQTLRVEHDNTGFAPAWLLNKVHADITMSMAAPCPFMHNLTACHIWCSFTQIEVISSLTMNEVAVFQCGQWLATDLGDGSLWRVLSASHEDRQSLLSECPMTPIFPASTVYLATTTACVYIHVVLCS